MREILFRGKGIDNDWYYGVPLVFTEDYVCMTAPHTYNKKVETNTMGQFTGLTDKSGKKIFEGDIINIKYPETTVKNCIIEYVGASFVGSTCADNWELDGYYLLEVIGNIHDNPELLEGGNE